MKFEVACGAKKISKNFEEIVQPFVCWFIHALLIALFFYFWPTVYRYIENRNYSRYRLLVSNFNRELQKKIQHRTYQTNSMTKIQKNCRGRFPWNYFSQSQNCILLHVIVRCNASCVESIIAKIDGKMHFLQKSLLK